MGKEIGNKNHFLKKAKYQNHQTKFSMLIMNISLKEWIFPLLEGSMMKMTLKIENVNKESQKI